MRNGIDAMLGQSSKRKVTAFGGRQENVEYVPIGLAVVRNDPPSQDTACFQMLQPRVIRVPLCDPVSSDVLRPFELRAQNCRRDVARQIGGADIDPGIFVDFSALNCTDPFLFPR